MKLKQLILTAIFIISCISIGFAQTDREKGIELFNKGDYKGAVDVLNQVIKANENDVIALYNLGLAYEKLNQKKDAVKSFEKAIISCNDIIEKIIEEKYFGVITDNKDSIENLLKIYTTELESGYSSLQKFTQHKKSDAKSAEWKSVFTYIEAYAPNTKFFVSSEKMADSDFKIISQPGTKLPETGVVRLRVLFLPNGKVGAVVPYDFKSKKMNVAATRVAKLIIFKPLIKNGQPVSVWKTVEYRFSIF